jgi:hypothetical protein
MSEHGLVLGIAVPTLEDGPDDWAGRWALVKGTTLGLDACGLLGVFYRDGWYSSSPELLRLIPPELREVENRLVYESGLDWFPPPRSGISGIRRLLPSQTIDFATGELRPRPLLVPSDPDPHGLAEMLVAALVNFADRRVIVPLTGGRDSRVILAAALKAGLDVVTYTAIRLPRFSHADLTLPPKLSEIAGVPHYAIRPGKPRPELVDLFDRHSAHHCVDVERRGLASGDTPSFAPLLSGHVFELGRCFYYGELPAELDDATLAQKPVHEWASWIQEHPEPIDWRDRFYWEQRLAGWSSSFAQAGDLAPPERFYPANSRRFASGLLAFPEAVRRRSDHQRAILESLSPELAAVPINPEPGSKVSRRIKYEARLLKRDRHRYPAGRVAALRRFRSAGEWRRESTGAGPGA